MPLTTTVAKGLYVKSDDATKNLAIRGNGVNSEFLIQFKTKGADVDELPLYLKSSTVSILRGATKTNLQTLLTSHDTSIATNAASSATNATNLSTEAATARAAESANAVSAANNATAISGEATTRAAADLALQDNIDAANTSVGAAIATIQSDHTTEVNRAVAAELGLSDGITNEAATRAADIITERDLARAAEALNASNLAAEITRATGVENTNAADITSVANQVGLILGSSPANLDTLQELVAEYTASGATIQGNLDTQIAAYAAKMVLLDASILALENAVNDLVNPPA